MQNIIGLTLDKLSIKSSKSKKNQNVLCEFELQLLTNCFNFFIFYINYKKYLKRDNMRENIKSFISF